MRWRTGAGQGAKGCAVRRCQRRGACGEHRSAQARPAATPWQGGAGSRRRGAEALRTSGDEGAADRRAGRSVPDPAVRQGGGSFDLRRAGDGRGDTAGRPRQELRLAAARRPCGECAVHALGRPHCRQRRRGAAHHGGARCRCFVRCRARARREGPGQDPRVRRCGTRRSRRAYSARQNDEWGMTLQQPNSFRTGPDERGHFGLYGGRFVAETLMPLILDLERAYNAAKNDPAFKREMDGYLKNYVGRPSPLYFAERLTAHFGGAKIYLKREDLNHTGAHKINNCLGQILLAKRMGKTRIIAETGAGQHGVATATVAARFGLPCVIYMGEVDMERQKPNVFRMRLLGAEVRGVSSGSRTLKDAMNEALRDWVANVHDTFYIISSVVGPHPYPAMVRDFQT